MVPCIVELHTTSLFVAECHASELNVDPKATIGRLCSVIHPENKPGISFLYAEV